MSQEALTRRIGAIEQDEPERRKGLGTAIPAPRRHREAHFG